MEQTTQKKPWDLYSRFSADMQSARSCDDQERECREALQRLGFTLNIAERDEAIRAGATASRAGWQRILARARSQQISGVMVHELSRFSRDFFGGLGEIAELHKLGIRLADVHTVYELNQFDGMLKLAVGLAMSQQETDRLGERSKRGLRGKTLAKFSAGGQPPYGLARCLVRSATEVDIDGQGKRLGVKLVPNPHEAPIVRRIFRLCADKMAMRQIALLLNEEGISSKRAGHVRAGRVNSGMWSAAAISVILRNEIYIGVRVWNRHSRTGPKSVTTGKKRAQANPESAWDRVSGFVEPLIDIDLWEQVQRRLQATRKKYGERRTANVGQRKLLSGFVRCGSCGFNFVVGSHFKAGPAYRCGMHQTRGEVFCTNAVFVLQRPLEKKVKALLDAVAKDPEQLKALVDEHNRRISAANQSQRAAVHGLIERRNRLEAECANLRMAVAAAREPSVIGVLVKDMEDRQREVELLAHKIAEAEALVEPLLLPKPSSVTDYLAGRASLFTGVVHEDRLLLERVLDRIVVYASGDVVVYFREADLFGPLRFVRMEASERGGAEAPFSEDEAQPSTEAVHRAMSQRAASIVTEQVAQGLKPAVAAVERGLFVAYFAPGSDAEKALVTPRGFEPRLQP